MTQRVFDKTTNEGAAFIKYPLDLLQYRHHPDFKKGAETLYMLIVHYYDASKGYAYPSMTLLAADCATTESTIDKHIKSLEALELIKVIRRPKGNLYIPLAPLSRAAFFAKYLDVKAAYDKRYKKVEERREQRERYKAEIANIHNANNLDEDIAADGLW